MTRSLAELLLAWYDRERRDLPWRRSRDPWAIWVSEVMLQQTRVEVVVDAWQRFVARFPTPVAWARASDDELFAAWKGLGYYRRARLLREGAREVAERHGGRVPRDLDSLAALPGIGDYSRGAVASIASWLVSSRSRVTSAASRRDDASARSRSNTSIRSVRGTSTRR